MTIHIHVYFIQLRNIKTFRLSWIVENAINDGCSTSKMFSIQGIERWNFFVFMIKKVLFWNSSQGTFCFCFKVSSEKVSSDKVIENSVSTNDLIKLQQKINERLVSLEKRVDKLLLASNNGGKKIDFDKFEKLSSSFKKVEKKQIVI